MENVSPNHAPPSANRRSLRIKPISNELILVFSVSKQAVFESGVFGARAAPVLPQHLLLDPLLPDGSSLVRFPSRIRERQSSSSPIDSETTTLNRLSLWIQGMARAPQWHMPHLEWETAIPNLGLGPRVVHRRNVASNDPLIRAAIV